jgi:LacI family transcriptional regulator
MAGMKDVAARAGVSVATVSRVLNGNPKVAPATEARVRAAIEALHYRRNAVARSLRTDATKTLGLIIGDILNPFFAELARAVEDEARKMGYTVVIGNADERADRQDHYVRTLLEQRVDGLLICPTAEVTPLVRDLAGAGGPLVFLDRTMPGLEVPAVRVDGTEAIRDLVAHLVSLGHRRIAFISGPEQLSVPAGYLEEGDFQAASGRTITARLLDLPEPPEVIFAGDNLMALGALDEIRARGLRIPADVALASFDDVPWFVHLDPPITAISQPAQELGRRAVQAILARIGHGPIESAALPARLVVRRSCGEPESTEGA